MAVVPGSQHAPFRSPEGQFSDELQILSKPGQAVMFNGWLFHRGLANHSQQRRRVCLVCYQNAWMKLREPFDRLRVRRLREQGSAENKLLLGGVPN